MDAPLISPKLAVAGADEAIAFYAAVLGASPRQRFTAGDVVVFASLDVGGGQLQVKEADAVDPAPGAGGVSSIIDVQCADPDAIVARAVERGAAVVFPVQDQPYGSRQGRFRDPFGHQWIVGTPLALDDAAVQEALDSL